MSSRFKNIADKKINILSKILKVDPKSLREANASNSAKSSKHSRSSSSGMYTQVIANIQNRINNPLFDLTIADYELMCGNKMITKMMSKVLECDEKQLKKFCKYINIFNENINLSPKSIKNKMKPKMTLNKLPEELRTQIVKQYESLFPTKYVLRDWIPLDKIRWNQLSKNPNAIDLLREKITEESEMDEDDLEKLKESEKIDWEFLSANPAAIELLKANFDEIDFIGLSANPSDEAIKLLKDNPEHIVWGVLSANPSVEAIKLLENNIDEINWEMLSTNPNAINLLQKYYQEIDMFMLSANPNAIKLLEFYYDDIVWYNLSLNPSAIELLRERIDEEKNMPRDELQDLDLYNKINWDRLSLNPNAIELLKAKINEEKEMSEDELKNLDDYEKISWVLLSKNPNAIELLQSYPNKINWELLSNNANGFGLLKERVKYEIGLNKRDYDKLKDKIDWDALSANPSIFEAKKSLNKMDKKCPEGKVINPKTGRCIKKENIMKMINPTGPLVKECPEGKVRNPKTGRCIKKENLMKMMKIMRMMNVSKSLSK